MGPHRIRHIHRSYRHLPRVGSMVRHLERGPAEAGEVWRRRVYEPGGACWTRLHRPSGHHGELTGYRPRSRSTGLDL